MKILLAPAETKIQGGESPKYDKDNFFFQSFDQVRDKIVTQYESFIKESSQEELSQWFGIKDLKECEKYSKSIIEKPTMKAIQRYTGVAFEALDYNSLDKKSQDYCDKNIILFSNLFGPLKGDDLIPDYKFKQGAQLPGVDIIKEYKDSIKEQLDEFLGDEIIDLRAGFYDKFYKPCSRVITYKFLKEGKVVSHWAKFYRGKIVRELAKGNIQSFGELMGHQIEGLKLREIQEKKNIKTFIMDITD